MGHAALDIIFIQGIEVDCIVGLYPHERHTPQRLRVDVELELDTEPAAVRERLAATVNYASAAAQIAFLLRSCRFQLLESAAHVLARILLAPPAPGERRPGTRRRRCGSSGPAFPAWSSVAAASAVIPLSVWNRGRRKRGHASTAQPEHRKCCG